MASMSQHWYPLSRSRPKGVSNRSASRSERRSPSHSATTTRPLPAPRSTAAQRVAVMLAVSASEVEAVDVALGEDEGRAQQDLAAVDDLEVAQLASLDRGGAGLERPVGDRTQDVGRRVAEVHGIPEHDGLHAVLVDVGLDGVRCRQADEGELAALLGLRDCFRGGGRSDAGHSEESLEIATVLVDERSGLVEGKDVVLLCLDR